MRGAEGGREGKTDISSQSLADMFPSPLTTKHQFKDGVSNKVQETFSLQLEEPAKPATPAPAAGGGKKKKAAKKEGEAPAAAAAKAE